MQAALPPFACSHTPELPELLAQLGCSLLVSTYQAGKVIAISSDGEKLTQLPRSFDTPMGLALSGAHLAIATRHEIVSLTNEPRLAATYPKKPNHYDALFVPRSAAFCGALDVHDLAFGADGLIGVNTLFSCLFRPDAVHSFVPLWQPPFISRLAPEDRCHLNGLALLDGQPKYVTAFSTTDTAQGWRAEKSRNGILMDVPGGEILLRGLPMPHSPRVIAGKLYLLLSATGEIVCVDVARGRYDVVNRISGFVRGLAHHGDYLFVASSHLRRTHTFGDLPLAQENRSVCGITVLHRATGAVVGQLRYLNSCEEIYDVVVLPDVRRPALLGTTDPIFRRALSTPSAAYWGEVSEAARPPPISSDRSPTQPPQSVAPKS